MFSPPQSGPSPPSPGEPTDLHAECMRNAEWVLRHIDTVKYIVDTMKELGRDFGPQNVKCVSNANGTGGGEAEAGYMWRDSARGVKKGDIVLDETRLTTASEVERSLRHELIHAFDDLRGYVDPTNCYHQACSEIRAARLSGDCFFMQELKRGNMDPLSSGRKCVVRRAALAVEQNPLCRGFGARAVEVVLPRCYGDYEPFTAPLYKMGSYDPNFKPEPLEFPTAAETPSNKK
jgi:inner membrane protease ATP23